MQTTKLAVDIKFAINIHKYPQIFRGFHGYIHIHSRLSCVHIATKLSRNTAVPKRTFSQAFLS